MKDYVLSRLAQTDLDDIWEFTAKTWNVDQAEVYVSKMRQAIDQLVTGQKLSRSADDIGPGYRKLRVKSHFIFFRVEGDTLHVVRILHERMDFRSHLGN